jgi:putative DNA-invertase from lambdoid prophage Rac
MSASQRLGRQPKTSFRKSKRQASLVEPRRIVTETVSGSTAIAQRRGFAQLIDRLESGDVLIVTKLDRLGRDAIDVSTTSRSWRE